MTEARSRQDLLTEAEELEAQARELLASDNPSDLLPMEPENPDYFDRGDPNRRCTAHRKNGDRCRKFAILGGTVCPTHGGRARQVREKAQRRLSEAADRMANRLLGIAESDNVPAYVAVQAINSALDRAGVVEQKQIDVTIGQKPFEQVIEAAVQGGSRSDYRRANGLPDPVPELPAPNRPGGEDSGVRVLGETFDGNLVIESDPPGSTHADDEHLAGHRVPAEDSKTPSISLGNVLTPVRLPHGGYLPAEDAVTAAAEANRDFRRNLGRQ